MLRQHQENASEDSGEGEVERKRLSAVCPRGHGLLPVLGLDIAAINGMPAINERHGCVVDVKLACRDKTRIVVSLERLTRWSVERQLQRLQEPKGAGKPVTGHDDLVEFLDLSVHEEPAAPQQCAAQPSPDAPQLSGAQPPPAGLLPALAAVRPLPERAA